MTHTAIRRILFVCMGNICRSPAAENVMRHYLRRAGLDDQVSCDSAGIIGHHAGEPPDPRMRTAAHRRGLPMLGLARQVTTDDLAQFDLILAMDRDNLRGLYKLADDRTRDKIKLFCEYCTTHAHREVPDPYYGGPEGFELVLDILEDGCTELVKRIQHSEHITR